MNQSELIAALAEEAKLDKKQAEAAYKGLIKVIGDQLKTTGSIKLTGLGVMEVKKTSARTGRNPQTGQPIEIPEGKKIGFKPAQPLREAAGA